MIDEPTHQSEIASPPRRSEALTVEFPALHEVVERRRTPRHMAEAGAYIVVGTESLAVTIREYSREGLFLAFSPAAPSSLPLGDWVGRLACVEAAQSTLVETTGNQTSGTPLPPLQARIIRASAAGLGVNIEELPVEWARLLKIAYRPPLPIADIRDGHQAYEQLIKRCVSVYGTFSRKLASETLTRTANRLGALEGSDPFAAARYHYDAARVSLAANGERIIERFVAEGFTRVTAISEVVNILDRPAALGELRLMQADELENYLTVSALIKRVDQKVALALDQFEMRYIRLLGGVGGSIPAKQNPFGPSMTLRAFQHAVSDIELSPQSARLLYGELEAVALTRVPTLLQDLNQVLAAVSPAARAKLAPLQQARDAQTFLAESLPEAAVPAEPTRQLLAALRDKYGPGNTQLPRRALAIIESMATSARAEATSQIKILPTLVPLEGDTPEDAEASLPELLAAIDRLPMSAGGAFEQASTAEVVALMRQIGTENASGERRLGSAHEGVLDISSRLFKRASRDFVAQSDVEQMVKRLERTLLKLALRDGEFPSSPDHPARKVVNLIDQYNFAANDEGRLNDARLRSNLDGLVTRICEQADHDASIFSVVQHSLEQDLEGLKRERRLRIDRINEALESRDRVRVARVEVDTALAARLSERRMPRVLIALLDEVWRQHCVFIGLRYGVGSAPWLANLSLIERTLAVSAAGVDDPATLPLRSELFRDLSSALHTVVSDESLRARLLTELEALMVRADAELMADVMDAPRFGQNPSAMAGSTIDVRRALPALPPRPVLRIGDWWDMKIERKWIPVQLVWKSESTGFCGFVNRSASNRMELTVPDFHQQLSSGTARSRDSLDVPLLDRTESGLLNEAYSDAMQRSDRDPVTGLLNRKGLQKRLNELDALTDGGHFHVLGLLECDQFRMIASTCGVDASEALAKQLSELLQKRLPKDCLVALFREDTFAIVMPNYSRPAGLRTMSEQASKLADFHFKFEQHSFSIGIAVGIAAFGAGQCGAAEVLRRADAACLAAKAIGRNRVQEYEPDSAELKSEEALHAWAGRADNLLASDEALYLRAQMVMPIGADVTELPYYEILLGIEPIDGQNNGPFDFIVALERMGRSHEIDLWVMSKTFQWMTENWLLMDSIAGVAINLSAPSLRHPEVLRFLRQSFAQSSFPTQKILFEITESAAIRDFDAAELFIKEIHRYGCRFALDDFGSGFTSYAHLKRLSTDTLKIDGSYVKDLLGNASDLAIVKSMTDIAHTLGMKVVAEWVETPQILEKLISLGVDYAQGYAVHKPVRLTELTAPRQAATTTRA